MTSKGGTTERAIAVLEAGAVKATIVAAVKAAAARARASWATRFGRERRERHVRTRRSASCSTPCSGSSPTRFLLRFVMQWLRAPFRNPLGQAVVALTDWAVKPLRRVLPGCKGLDWVHAACSRGSPSSLWLLALALLVGRARFDGGVAADVRAARAWSSSSRRRSGS